MASRVFIKVNKDSETILLVEKSKINNCYATNIYLSVKYEKDECCLVSTAACQFVGCERKQEH